MRSDVSFAARGPGQLLTVRPTLIWKRLKKKLPEKAYVNMEEENMSTLKNLLFLVALLGATVAGYFVGARSGQDAKEALARLEAETKLAEAEHKKTTEQLNAKVTSLTANYDKEKKQIDADYAARHDKLSALLATRDAAIVDLKKRNSNDLVEIGKLRAHLEDPVSPEDRQATLNQIGERRADQKDAKLALRGEFCLKIPVPKEILASLQEGK
jgi:hypothetical protein